MWDAFVKIWFFIIILPIVIAQEAYAMLKGYLTRGNYWGDIRDNWMYVLLGSLSLLLLILLLLGYR